MRSRIQLCCYMLFIFYTNNVIAVEPESKLYVGVGFSNTNISMNTTNSSSANTNSTSDVQYSNIEQEPTSKIITIGYRFHKYYGIESSFQRFDEFGYTRAAIDVFNLNTVNEFTQTTVRLRKESVSGLSIIHVGYLPISKIFSITGSLGAYLATVDSTDMTTFTSVSSSGTNTGTSGGSNEKSSTATIFGLGVLANIGNNFAAKLSWRKYRGFSDLSTKDSSIYTTTLQMIYYLK